MKPRTIWLLVGLTLSAGYMDAVAFFGLGVFTANMTGNTVLLGGAIAARMLGDVRLPGGIGIVVPLLSIAGFVAGALVASTAVRSETQRPPLRSAALLAFVVALFVAAAVLYRLPHPLMAAAVALLSVAMGVQSVVAVRAGVPGVSTTFVTGTLLSAVMYLEGANQPHPAAGRANAGIWACYLLGAVAGTVALYRLGSNAFWPPAAAVALSAFAL
ncbi:MAG TPA: YoaK family protein [Candidatus Baltobacteraceae bacterium]|nr:YoaK family protein [Candidatus Baltobacteraceae bacterium]